MKGNLTGGRKWFDLFAAGTTGGVNGVNGMVT